MTDDYWKAFAGSGRVEEYLRYKQSVADDDEQTPQKEQKDNADNHNGSCTARSENGRS